LYGALANNGLLFPRNDSSQPIWVVRPETIASARETIVQGDDLVLLTKRTYSRGGYFIDPDYPSFFSTGELVLLRIRATPRGGWRSDMCRTI